MSENVILEEFKKRFYKRVDKEYTAAQRNAVKSTFADVLVDVLLNGGDGAINIVRYTIGQNSPKKKYAKVNPNIGGTL